MIIAKIQGGLGNQLFQYAFARRLSQVFDTPFKLDISTYDQSSAEGTRDKELGRVYTLGRFNTVEEFATADEIRALNKYRRHPGRYIHNLLVADKMKYLEEIKGFSEEYLNPPQLKKRGDVYLDGYWLTEQYFTDIGDVIRREFTVKNPPDVENARMLYTMRGSESVCLHVRRGDFALARWKGVHGLLPHSYYEKALGIIRERVPSPRFFVFSDDLPWVEEHLGALIGPATYVGHNGPGRDWEDMRLMNACKHFVIANSSFSWWGAWLSDYAKKIVIAPDKLRLHGTWKEYIPQRWIQIETELL